VKDWERCLEEDVYRREKDIGEAKSLLRMAKVRKEDNERREIDEDNVPLIVETYWEITKQLITALLNLDGYKSYSQECLLSYLEEFYEFTEKELHLMNQLRKLRNDIDYRGKFLDRDYLQRNEEKIEKIISKLQELVENKL